MEAAKVRSVQRQSSLLAYLVTPKRTREQENTCGTGAIRRNGEGDGEEVVRLPKRLRTVAEPGWRGTATIADSNGHRCVIYEDSKGSRLRYWAHFLPIEEASQLYLHLRDTTKWSQGGRTRSMTSAKIETIVGKQAPAATANTREKAFGAAQAREANNTPRLQKVA